MFACLLSTSCLIASVLHYTVPLWESTGCDSLVTVCDSLGDCQQFHFPERMGRIEVWWGPRWGSYSKLYEKSVAGLEGQRDTISVPSDTIGTVFLVARDRAGNRSCEGNTVTVNLPPTSVPEPPRPPRIVWYDVSGRILRERPNRPGIYWELAPGKRRRLVVIR